MQDDDKPAEKTDPVKSIDAAPSTAARSDVGSKAV
jgi:sec-independent protein translocase protein TatA